MAQDVVLKTPPLPKGLMAVLTYRHSILAVLHKVKAVPGALRGEGVRDQATPMCLGAVCAHDALATEIEPALRTRHTLPTARGQGGILCEGCCLTELRNQSPLPVQFLDTARKKESWAGKCVFPGLHEILERTGYRLSVKAFVEVIIGFMGQVSWGSSNSSQQRARPGGSWP